MAGDWIPMRTNLDADPAVIAMAVELNVSECDVVGRLHRFWSWANQHIACNAPGVTCNAPGVTCNAPGVTPAWLDRYVGTPGFAFALQRAGWLDIGDKGLHVPNFSRWNSQSAKQRQDTATRVAKHRAKKATECNANGNAHRVTDALPEKRREEKRVKTEEPPTPAAAGDDPPPLPAAAKSPPKPQPPDPAAAVPLPPALDSPGFRAAWADWLAERKARRKPLTPRQAELQLAKLAPLGPAGAAACVLDSIAHGWAGLFPEKHHEQHRRDGPRGDVRPRPGRCEAPPGKYTHLDGPGLSSGGLPAAADLFGQARDAA